MQAIVTKYLGPTNHRGARVKASCEAGALTVSWDYALSSTDNHAAAAERFDWLGNGYELVSGHLPSGQVAHVFAARKGA